MRIIIFLLFLTHALFSRSLESLVESAMKNDPKILLLKEKIRLANEDIKSSDIWENPVLTAGLKDILLDDPLSRDIEPMQTQFIGISQKIPLSDKFSVKKDIALKKRQIVDFLIENEKRKISSQLSAFLYEKEILKKRLSLLHENRKNLYTIKRLLKGYRADEDLLLDIDRLVLMTDLQNETIENSVSVIKEKIKLRTLQSVEKTKISLKPKEINASLNPSHPMLEVYKKDIEIAKDKLSLFKAEKISDIKVGMVYNQRVATGDYISLSFSMPLQIRDKENIAIKKASYKLSYQKKKLLDLENSFKNRIKVYEIMMKKSALNYALYQKRLLPLQKKITRYLKAKNITGNLDLSRLVQSYNKIISLEQRALDELNEHFGAYSKLRYYL